MNKSFKAGSAFTILPRRTVKVTVIFPMTFSIIAPASELLPITAEKPSNTLESTARTPVAAPIFEKVSPNFLTASPYRPTSRRPSFAVSLTSRSWSSSRMKSLWASFACLDVAPNSAANILNFFCASFVCLVSSWKASRFAIASLAFSLRALRFLAN